MIGISDGVRSVREGRMLAVKPELKDIFIEKSDYGKRCENWFNDHFRGRVFLMKVHDVLRNKLSYIIRTEKAIYFKENGWDFLLPLISDLDCRPSSLQSIVQNIVQLNEFCQQNQIKLYVLEVPKKEIVYKGLIKTNYGFDEKKLAKVSQAEEFIRNGVRKYHIPYIYPDKPLCDAANSDFVFFKWKHHWTDWGAFVGYQELMKEIRKDFSDMPIVLLNDYRKSQSWLIRDEYWGNHSHSWHFGRYFNSKDVDMPGGLSNRVFYNYYDHKNGDRMIIKVGKFTKEFVYPTGKRKLMLIGTSQNENLNHFLPFSFAQTEYIRLNMEQVKTLDELKILKLYKKDILAFKPDILILSISTDNLPQLRDLCSTK